VEYAAKGRLKLSTKKLLYPGRKQVFRQVQDARMAGDVIGRFDETLPGEPLLQPLLRRGRPAARVELNESRECLRREFERLPAHLRSLETASPPYLVKFSKNLQDDFELARQRLSSRITPTQRSLEP
jgi:nicotinate phosphoribosyltransferase